MMQIKELSPSILSQFNKSMRSFFYAKIFFYIWAASLIVAFVMNRNILDIGTLFLWTTFPVISLWAGATLLLSEDKLFKNPLTYLSISSVLITIGYGFLNVIFKYSWKGRLSERITMYNAIEACQEGLLQVNSCNNLSFIYIVPLSLIILATVFFWSHHTKLKNGLNRVSLLKKYSNLEIALKESIDYNEILRTEVFEEKQNLEKQKESLDLQNKVLDETLAYREKFYPNYQGNNNNLTSNKNTTWYWIIGILLVVLVILLVWNISLQGQLSRINALLGPYRDLLKLL